MHPCARRPSGVNHCREQFKFFPCCDLHSDGDPAGSKLLECDNMITKQFEEGGHFGCEDLVANDPEALFFFIKEGKDLQYSCISVCTGGSARHLLAAALIAIMAAVVM